MEVKCVQDTVASDLPSGLQSPHRAVLSMLYVEHCLTPSLQYGFSTCTSRFCCFIWDISLLFIPTSCKVHTRPRSKLWHEGSKIHVPFCFHTQLCSRPCPMPRLTGQPDSFCLGPLGLLGSHVHPAGFEPLCRLESHRS